MSQPHRISKRNFAHFRRLITGVPKLALPSIMKIAHPFIAVTLVALTAFPMAGFFASRSLAQSTSDNLVTTALAGGPVPRRAQSANDAKAVTTFTPPRIVSSLAAAAPAPLAAAVGTWTPLVTPAPGRIQLMLLLSDGTVMAAESDTGSPSFATSNKWYRLTPDIHGSYANGTWTTLQPMNDTRLFYVSFVLPSGKVFVAGGEYGTGKAKAEVYNPLNDPANGGSGNPPPWTAAPIPTSLLDPTQPSPLNPTVYNQGLSDANGMLLRDGKVLIAPVLYKTAKQTLLYNPATNGWSAGPNFLSSSQDEASWVKLPDESILTADPSATTSERYIPSSNTWIADGSLPAPLFDTVGTEIGAPFLLPDGRAFFLGGNGNTALYTPSGNASPGTWAAGKTIPNVIQYPEDNNGNQVPGSAFLTQGATPDSAAAMMPNGRILCALSGALYNDPRVGTIIPGSNNYWKTAKNPRYPAPTSFYEYDPTTDTFAPVNGPTGTIDNIAAYQSMMLDLPDGTVLYAHQNTDLYIYQPSGSPVAAGKPTITNFTKNPDGSYHLIGRGLNGISEGAAYGDDAQMDTNYPIVRLSASNGNIYYARTFNWSSTGVSTGAAPVTTEFTLPAGLPNGTYDMVVVANGIASDSVPFSTTASAPVVTVTSPPNNSFIQGFTVIQGTATDNGGPGIAGNSVNFTLYHVGTGQYWSGSGWGSTQVQFSAPIETTTNVWTYSGQLPNAAGGTLRTGQYALSASTHDSNGVNSVPQSGVNNIFFTVDTTPPAVAIASPVNGSLINTGSYALTGTANDASGILQVNCFIRRLSDNFYWDGSGWGVPPINLVTHYDAPTAHWNCTDPLPQPGSALVNGGYDFIAIAYDNAGNTTQADSVVTVDYHPTYTWTGVTSSAWGVSTNWAPNGVPGPGDIAIIGNGNFVDSSIPRLVYGLRLGGGSSLGHYIIEITGGNGVSVWSSGTLGSQNQINVDAGASLTIDTTGSPILNAGIINNAGTVVLSGNSGFLNGANNGTINNTGAFQITREGTVAQDLGNNAVFNNLAGGTLVKLAGSGTGTATMQWQLNNGGTVEADSGTLAFSDGSSASGGSSGLFLTIAGAARIEFSGGTHVLNAGASFRGVGRGRVSAGVVSLAGAATAGQSAPALEGSFEVTGTGGLAGAGSLSLVGGSGTFAWSSSGTIGATVSVGAGCQLAIDTTNTPYLNAGVINNAGTAVLSGAAGILYGANNAAINNTGVFQITREGNITQDLGNNAIFNNLAGGTLVKTTPGNGSGTATVGWQLNNNGTVEADSGTLAFAEGSSASGGSAGLFLTIAGAARIEFSGGTHVLKAGASFRGVGRGRVSAGVVSLAGAATAGQSAPALEGSFEVTGTGGLAGAGSLSLVGGSGTFAWSSGGTIGATVSVGAGCQLAIDTTNTPYLNAGVINNAGTAVLSGAAGILYGANNAAINNTGVFQITREGNITQDLGNNAIFNNLAGGTLVKTTPGNGSGTATVGWQLNNNGTVEADSGTLAFAEGSSASGGSAGLFLTIAGAARIEFSGGTHVLKAGASFRGVGRGRVSAGVVSLAGAATAGQSAPALEGSFEVTGTGGLAGAGSLSLVGGSGTFAWSSSGTIGATVSVGAGCQLAIDTTNTPYLNAGVINNAGTAVLSGAAGILYGANNAAINNTGVFQITREGSVAQDLGNNAIFNNLAGGALVKPAGSGTATMQWQLNNSGTVEADSGTLAFNEGSSVSGGSNGMFLSTVAAARIEFSGGTHVLKAGASFRGVGRGRVSAGVVSLAGAATAGQSAPALEGSFEVTGTGGLAGVGSLSLVGGSGTFAWSSGGTIGATVSVGAGCQLAIDTTSSPLLNAGIINNAGTAVLSGAAGILYGANNAAINNTGVFQIARSGAIAQNLGNNATFNNAGNLSLSSTASIVTLGWAYNQSVAGTLNLKIGGTNAGTPQFDQFQCTGAATLGGRLNVSFIGGFLPVVGNNFAVMTYSSHTGSFSSVSTAGALMSKNYNPSNFILTAVSTPASFNEWKSVYFGDTSSAVDLAVPYGDGVANLLKYALSMDPTKASVTGLPVAQNAGGHLTLGFSRKSPSDVTYTVLASDGLGAWIPIAQLAAGADTWTGTGAVAEPVTGGIRSVTVTDPEATAAHAKRFLHLQVMLP